MCNRRRKYKFATTKVKPLECGCGVHRWRYLRCNFPSFLARRGEKGLNPWTRGMDRCLFRKPWRYRFVFIAFVPVVGIGMVEILWKRNEFYVLFISKEITLVCGNKRFDDIKFKKIIIKLCWNIYIMLKTIHKLYKIINNRLLKNRNLHFLIKCNTLSRSW